MPENTTAYRHVLVPAKDGPLLEWMRVQTGCRSLTKTLSLLLQIATTPEGLAFIKNHPLSPGDHPPVPGHRPGWAAEEVRRKMLAESEAWADEQTRAKAQANEEHRTAVRTAVGAAVAARTLNGEV